MNPNVIAGLACCGMGVIAVFALLVFVFHEDRLRRRDREEYWRNK